MNTVYFKLMSMSRLNLKYLMYITTGEDVTFLGFLKTTDRSVVFIEFTVKLIVILIIYIKLI
jgi:hypothetical protein